MCEGMAALHEAKKKILFVSCNGPKKNRVGRTALFFWSKMCVLCMFTLIWSWMGGKNLRVGIYLNKNLLG